MEVRAVAKYVKVQPRKVRVVAAEVKGASAVMSAHKLRFHPSKSATLLRKVLVSAIANAENNHGLAPQSLKIKSIAIDQGPVMKRMDAKAMGRGARIRRKTAHITVIVEDSAPEAAEATKAKAKPRPKFEAPKKAKKAEKAAPVEEAKEEVKEEEAPVTEETPVEATAETTAPEGEEKKED